MSVRFSDMSKRKPQVEFRLLIVNQDKVRVTLAKAKVKLQVQLRLEECHL